MSGELIRTDLPLIRSGERVTYKRCQRKWYYAWRLGLVPRQASFGPLELGTWMHYALATWYGLGGYRRQGELAEHLWQAFLQAHSDAIRAGAPEHLLEKARELAELGVEVAKAYQRFWGEDGEIYVLAAEVPLEFEITYEREQRIAAIHRLKPDLVFRDPDGGVWLMEHKTAAQIGIGHLSIDDQARPYGVMAERALRKLGIIKAHQEFKGIKYNFLRKALPDMREVNAAGKYLNKNGTVSKRQPTPQFLRHPVTLTKPAKIRALRRIQQETCEVTDMAELVRSRRLHPSALNITPHKSCPKLCDYFSICEMEENGLPTADAIRAMFVRRNPYLYDEENPTTDETVSFEVTG